MLTGSVSVQWQLVTTNAVAFVAQMERLTRRVSLDDVRRIVEIFFEPDESSLESINA